MTRGSRSPMTSFWSLPPNMYSIVLPRYHNQPKSETLQDPPEPRRPPAPRPRPSRRTRVIPVRPARSPTRRRTFRRLRGPPTAGDGGPQGPNARPPDDAMSPRSPVAYRRTAVGHRSPPPPATQPSTPVAPPASSASASSSNGESTPPSPPPEGQPGEEPHPDHEGRHHEIERRSRSVPDGVPEPAGPIVLPVPARPKERHRRDETAEPEPKRAIATPAREVGQRPEGSDPEHRDGEPHEAVAPPEPGGRSRGVATPRRVGPAHGPDEAGDTGQNEDDAQAHAGAPLRSGPTSPGAGDGVPTLRRRVQGIPVLMRPAISFHARISTMVPPARIRRLP